MVACLDTTDQIYKDGYLIIEDSRIVDIGLQKDLSQQANFDTVLDLGNRLIMLGLINAHTHDTFPRVCGRAHLVHSRWMVQHDPSTGNINNS